MDIKKYIGEATEYDKKRNLMSFKMSPKKKTWINGYSGQWKIDKTI